MIKRRRDVRDWPISQLLRQTVLCLTSDPDQLEVRGSVVLHQDPDLLPKDAEQRAAAEAAEEGVPFDGLPEYVVFNLGFDEEDRTALYMDHDRTVLVREVDVARDLPSAEAKAHAWVGEGGEQFPFQNIPGVYQAAFVEFVTGKRVEHRETELMWALPAQGDHVPFGSSRRG